MPFRKFSDEHFFKLKLEGYSKAEAIASALLYMEYRIVYNSKKTHLQEARLRRCLAMLHAELLKSKFLAGSEAEINWMVGRAAWSNGWKSVECIIDGLDLRAGGSGSMPYQLKASLLGVLKNYLEVDCGIPVTRIIRKADGELNEEIESEDSSD